MFAGFMWYIDLFKAFTTYQFITKFENDFKIIVNFPVFLIDILALQSSVSMLKQHGFDKIKILKLCVLCIETDLLTNLNTIFKGNQTIFRETVVKPLYNWNRRQNIFSGKN